MPSPWHGATAHLYPMLRVEADDDTGAPVDLAVDPNLAVVVDVRLEPHARARQRDPGDPFGYGDGDPVPREGESLGQALADIAAHLPARVVVIRQAGRGRAKPSGEPLVRLTR